MTPEEEEREGMRRYRHVAAARLCFLTNEKANLQSIHTALFEQCKAIQERMDIIERHIRVEKASVNP